MASLNSFDLQEKVAALQDALLSSHPTMPTLLRQIHTLLRADPEQVTLLSEEDISVIVRGLSKQTQVELVASSLKSRTKSLKSLSLDDL